MPPVKRPPKSTHEAPFVAFVTLLAQNMDAHGRWLRRGEPGHELPHNVIKEVILGHVSHHLILAVEGRQWTPPAQE